MSKRATVSICVADPEQQVIREAAVIAQRSVSAYAALNIASAMETRAARSRALAAVQNVQASLPRPGRISTVLDAETYKLLKSCATGAEVTVHALAQAIVLDAARADVADAPAAAIKAAQENVKLRVDNNHLTVIMPAEYVQQLRTIGIDRVSIRVRELLDGMTRAIRADKCSGMSEGVRKVAERLLEADMDAVRLRMDPRPMASVAYVLEVQPSHLAMAIAIKAVKMLTPDPTPAVSGKGQTT